MPLGRSQWLFFLRRTGLSIGEWGAFAGLPRGWSSAGCQAFQRPLRSSLGLHHRVGRVISPEQREEHRRGAKDTEQTERRLPSVSFAPLW